MKNFQIRVKRDFFDKAPAGADYDAKHLTENKTYEVIGTVGDRLLIRGDYDSLVTLYPRWCTFVDYMNEEQFNAS